MVFQANIKEYVLLTVRLYFTKTKDAKYISHLDLVRCFTRAIRRSQVDIWYTEGFSSRPYLLFALPLSLGIESIYEVVDIRVKSESISNELIYSLNDFLPEGIEIFKYTLTEGKKNNISAAKYNIEFIDTEENIDTLSNVIDNTILKPETILVDKKSKRGIILTDIKNQIHEISYTMKDDKILLAITVDAGNANNLNPILIVTKILENIDFSPDYSIIRTGILTNDGNSF